MIFAAGLGTRLGIVTQSIPKALVPVAGVPILERVANRLVSAGAERLIINTHHLAEQIAAFVASKHDFGVEVLLSAEPTRPLETGGGLLRASGLFQGRDPFFLHNVDIVSDLPLERVYATHLERAPLATLVVMERQSSRALLFDDQGLLGRVDDSKALRIEARPCRGTVHRLAFCGIHVVSPTLPGQITEEGVFSILDPYLRLVAEGHRIEPFRADGYAWVDIGRPDSLAEASAMIGR